MGISHNVAESRTANAQPLDSAKIAADILSDFRQRNISVREAWLTLIQLGFSAVWVNESLLSIMGFPTVTR